MKSKEYWKKRFEQLEQSLNNDGVEAYARIENHYKKAQQQIESEIRTWYQRFAINNEISMIEARKLLTEKELEEFKWNVRDYIKHGKENAVNPQWTKQLENASARFHISRLEALKISTQHSVELLFGNQIDTVDAAMRGIYSKGYNHTMYELQKGFSIGWNIGKLDNNHISKVLNKPWAADSKNFSERLWGNKTKLVNELHNELTQNIILGKDPQKAIDNIARKMHTSKNNAGRVVMTEKAFFASASQRDCFNELGVEKYEIVATLDSHTSVICRDLDGEVFSMEDFQPGVTAPPFHPWCRSTTVPFFDDELSFGERVARNSDGEVYYIPSDCTYREWENTFLLEPELSREYFDLKHELKAFEIQTYNNIWKDGVTTLDWKSKKYSIPAKVQYFKSKIISTNGEEKEKFTQLLSDLNNFSQNGEKYYNLQTQFNKARDQLTMLREGSTIKANPFSQDRKDTAYWFSTTQEADDVLRENCGDAWKRALPDQKEAIYNYTQGSGSFNRPLSGFQKPYYEGGTGWEKKYYKGIGNVWIDYEDSGNKIRAMTELIDKSEYDFDIWLQRGCDLNAMNSFFQAENLWVLDNDGFQKFIGHKGRIYSFVSTSVNKGSGFSDKPVILNIYAPRGTKMMYAEPFSHFGNGDKLGWDGEQGQYSFGSEAEMIIQRGASYVVTKIESSDKLYIDLEVHPEEGYELIQQNPEEWKGDTENFKEGKEW